MYSLSEEMCELEEVEGVDGVSKLPGVGNRGEVGVVVDTGVELMLECVIGEGIKGDGDIDGGGEGCGCKTVRG